MFNQPKKIYYYPKYGNSRLEGEVEKVAGNYYILKEKDGRGNNIRVHRDEAIMNGGHRK